MGPVEIIIIVAVATFVFVSVRYPSAIKRLATPLDATLDIANLKVNDMRDSVTKTTVTNGKSNSVSTEDLTTFETNQTSLKAAREAILGV